jgi:hypothetical protein
VSTFEEIDGLEELVLADAQVLGGLEEVGDVLHLHEGRRGLLNPRHRAGVERVGQPTFITITIGSVLSSAYWLQNKNNKIK